MNRRNQKLLIVALLIAISCALTFLAALIHSDFLRHMAIVICCTFAGAVVSSQGDAPLLPRQPKAWAGLAIATLLVTTFFWVIEKMLHWLKA